MEKSTILFDLMFRELRSRNIDYYIDDEIIPFVLILIVVIGIAICAIIAQKRGSPYYIAWSLFGLLGVFGIMFTLIACPNRYVIVLNDPNKQSRTNNTIPKDYSRKETNPVMLSNEDTRIKDTTTIQSDNCNESSEEMFNSEERDIRSEKVEDLGSAFASYLNKK